MNECTSTNTDNQRLANMKTFVFGSQSTRLIKNIILTCLKKYWGYKHLDCLEFSEYLFWIFEYNV
jgi:hypothetical protein